VRNGVFHAVGSLAEKVEKLRPITGVGGASASLVLLWIEMEFFWRSARKPRRLGVFPGTFNPVTVAHMALAEGALAVVDEVVFILPRRFPHKTYRGASFEQRVELLGMVLGGEPGYSVAASERGLFAEIAGECRSAYGADARLSFLCGRDAAERVANWDYGRRGAYQEMLQEFDLLVAARDGEYHPPESLVSSCAPLELSGGWDHVSASEVRARISRGEPWEHLVPAVVRRRIGEIYTAGGEGQEACPTDR
jgi:nicotinate-nucleotide adenylyltransferase